jgi:hypothetical protein
MAITHENILKVLDIHYSEFSKEFIGFIAGKQPTYKDRILEEDMFSPEDLKEDAPCIAEDIREQLTEVATLMQQMDCGYFRIIYT